MAYTQSDLDAVKNAVVALATGARVQSVTLSDGKSITYTPASLDRLKALRSEIESELNSSSRRRYFRVGSSKGYG